MKVLLYGELNMIQEDILNRYFDDSNIYYKLSFNDLQKSEKNVYDIAIVYYDDNDKFDLYKKQLISIGICKILKYKMLELLNKDSIDIVKLISNPPTIFCNDCVGGLFSNTLGLPLNSPLVNLFIGEDEYIKFLKNPKKYLEFNPEFVCYKYDTNDLRYFPTANLGDITLNCVHYNDFDEFLTKWQKRKERINYDNLLVMFVTTDEKLVDEFVKLDYKHKICFCPFDYDDECVVKCDSKNVDWYFYMLCESRNINFVIDIINNNKSLLEE